MKTINYVIGAAAAIIIVLAVAIISCNRHPAPPPVQPPTPVASPTPVQIIVTGTPKPTVPPTPTPTTTHLPSTGGGAPSASQAVQFTNTSGEVLIVAICENKTDGSQCQNTGMEIAVGESVRIAVNQAVTVADPNH